MKEDQVKEKMFEAMKWLKEKEGMISFSKGTNGDSLCLIQVNGYRSCTNSFFESLKIVKDKMADGRIFDKKEKRRK